MHLGMPQYRNHEQMMKILKKIKEDVQESTDLKIDSELGSYYLVY